MSGEPLLGLHQVTCEPRNSSQVLLHVYWEVEFYSSRGETPFCITCLVSESRFHGCSPARARFLRRDPYPNVNTPIVDIHRSIETFK